MAPILVMKHKSLALQRAIKAKPPKTMVFQTRIVLGQKVRVQVPVAIHRKSYAPGKLLPPKARRKRGIGAKDAVVLRALDGTQTNFQFNARLKAFEVDGVRCSGVCAFVDRNVFRPGQSKNKMFSGLSRRFQPMEAFLPSGSHKKKGKKGRGSALARGRKIHNDMDKWIKAGARVEDLPKSGYVRTIATELAKHGLIPYRGEMPVYWKETKMATRADIVCHDRQGRIVIVELKTSVAAYSAILAPQLQQTFAPPFHDLPTSLMTTFHLQALATVILFDKSAGMAQSPTSGVLVACGGGTLGFYCPTPANVVEKRAALIERMMARVK